MTRYRICIVLLAGIFILWLAPFVFLLSKLLVCAPQRGALSHMCLTDNISALIRTGIVPALENSLVIGIASALMTLLIMIGLIQGGLRKSNGWFYILAPAVGMRCIPPIAFLISHFVMVELVEQYVPTFRTSIWLIVAFHSISALPLALLIVVPRLNRLHTPNTNEGGLFDMAQMDGLSAGTYFAHILFPNLRSEFLLAGLMAFSVSWSESLYAGVFQNGRENWTMPVFIAAFETSYQIAWAQLFASMAASIFVLVALAVVSVRLLNYELHLD